MKTHNRRLLLPYVSGLVACGILIWASPTTAQNSRGDLGSFEKRAKVEVTLSEPESVGQGDSNSFGIAVDGVFTAPSGKSYVVPGFYDGDGRGELDGSVWKVRFSADETGQWSFRSRSKNKLLDGRTESFTVTAPPDDAPDFYRWGNMGAEGHGLNCEFPQKWMSDDGQTLWCVFSVYGDGGKSGVNAHDKFNLVKVTLSLAKDSAP